MYSLQEYDYDLPVKCIAQEPVKQRDLSRLLFLNRESGRMSHHRFTDLYDFLSPNDVLVVNNTKVIPGRLLGKKETGGRAEVLLLDYASGSKRGKDPGIFICNCLVKTSKGPKAGDLLFFDKRLQGEIVKSCNGIFTIKFIFSGDFENLLYKIGKVPLPPYIKRSAAGRAFRDDRISYQTVYAQRKGAIAAPTAGLHFSKKLLEKIESKGVKIVAITLHVGYGTFSPVRAGDIREHTMHPEAYCITKECADAINQAKANSCRIVAVGTTCVRALEFASDSEGTVLHGKGECDLFIYPGYEYKTVDAMITNFHLPQSTLLMLVSAFAGRETVLRAYKKAISEGYRFYSYGDAMYIAYPDAMHIAYPLFFGMIMVMRISEMNTRQLAHKIL